jgi:hypothetical protein
MNSTSTNQSQTQIGRHPLIWAGVLIALTRARLGYERAQIGAAQ